ncbi:MAG: phosphatase PAP2 family protein [Acidobacteriia bacterium]|nr:phosphatase PAP2 family protein [Terriglobia bacterium]
MADRCGCSRWSNTLTTPINPASLALLLLTTSSALLGQVPDPPPADLQPGPERTAFWTKLVPNTLSDQKQIWTFPLKLGRGKHWIPAAAIVGATAGLVALDPKTAPYFRRTSSFDGFNHAFSGKATSIGMIVAPVSFYAAGLIRKDSRMQSTALLAGEAVVNAEILTTVMKDIDRRLRPAVIDPHGDFSDTWFQDHTRNFRSNGSFPSGHTIAAFSVATVFARRYGRQHRWVPYVAYGSAALIGLSRVTVSSHFVSDVFMGGALGYSISRFVVLRQ